MGAFSNFLKFHFKTFDLPRKKKEEKWQPVVKKHNQKFHSKTKSFPYTKPKRPCDWGYNGSALDPDEWHRDFPCGCGLSQSPINIDMSSVQYSEDLKPLKVSYSKSPNYLKNDGHNISVVYNKGSTLTGANLENEYELVQFHFHWGEKDGIGSEHAIDNVKCDAELHLVHKNVKYGDVSEALEHSDGLAVLGVFLSKNDSEAPETVKPIISRFSSLKDFDKNYECKEPFDAYKMVPDMTHFMTYDGSLTTPPLSQCVKWIVLRTPQYVSTEELELFRDLERHFGANFRSNWRPLQELNGRTVSTNIRK